jgi:3-dehydroquinate dehydratase / shikimate dehydrogenase
MLFQDKICGVVAASTAHQMWVDLVAATKRTRTIELRLDYLSSDDEIRKFLNKLASARVPAILIATCRRRSAGGLYRGTTAGELLHLAEALRAGCRWFDLDFETARIAPPGLLSVLLSEGRLLASAHFFRAAPKHLSRVAGQLDRLRPSALKIAVECESLAESLCVLRLAKRRHRVVAIPMGEVALAARVLALRHGSALTYAPLATSTAPGQISLDAMKYLYRADRLTHRTSVYGVIGDPVSHSLSPEMHNAAFQSRGIDAVYLPFLVRDLRDFLLSVEPLGLAGFSVTIPHKQKILRHLDGCDPLARAIGAVNTVVVRGGGKLYGYNTDYVGVLAALSRRMPLCGSRVLILGAGGAARAVAFALAKSGASFAIAARRPSRAKALAEAAGGEVIALGEVRRQFFDALVNATPVGMHPQENLSPLQASELNCRLVFDTIYRPQRTKLLRLAERRGIETVSGVEMFLAQGAAQWQIWTGERAPLAVMRRAVLRALPGR